MLSRRVFRLFADLRNPPDPGSAVSPRVWNKFSGRHASGVKDEQAKDSVNEVASSKRTSILDSRPARAGSWMALLAATTLGDGADTLRAEVKGIGLADSGSYRLVVQSYEEATRALPSPRVRPVASFQRAVTADELRRGVAVSLVQLRAVSADDADESPMVVAWVESGDPDLEFDGLTARPSRGSVYGVAKRANGTTRIVLTRKFAD